MSDHGAPARLPCSREVNPATGESLTPSGAPFGPAEEADRTDETEHEAGVRFDDERNARAGREINAAADAARDALAGRILKMLRSVPDTELSMGEIGEAAGSNETQTRGAVALLVKAGDVAMCAGGYYSARVTP